MELIVVGISGLQLRGLISSRALVLHKDITVHYPIASGGSQNADVMHGQYTTWQHIKDISPHHRLGGEALRTYIPKAAVCHGVGNQLSGTSPVNEIPGAPPRARA